MCALGLILHFSFGTCGCGVSERWSPAHTSLEVRLLADIRALDISA
jgi:hypothetical protein